ncbi:MAG TPA: ABC transporter permease [Vicinamibacterales bacterium]|nr:ABC transporter permease [Vicinamibacterales bacterium]
MIEDLRYAVRVLLQGKAWSIIVVLSLALGIGANTALFSATNGLLLRKLPVADPDSLVRLRHVGRNHAATNVNEYGFIARDGDVPAGSTFSYPMFQQLRRGNQTMTDLFAGAPMGSVNVVVDGHAEIATAFIASGNFHQLLGIRSMLGRTLLPDDDRPDASPVAVISAGFWSRRFGRDPSVIGKVIQANDVLVTIVGVTPPEFTGVQRAVADASDLVLPLALDPLINPPPPAGGSRLSQPTSWWLQIMGRLEPGATPEQVEGNLGGVFQQAAREGIASYLASLPAEERGSTRNRNLSDVPQLDVSSAVHGLYDNNVTTTRAIAILSAVVGLILLLVCANVANLLLSRAAARQKEITLRLSIGATRVRLIRQLLTESILLASAGGALGLAVAYWGKRLLPGTTGQAPLDWRVLLFAAVVAIVTGILFGLAPALRVTSASANDMLKDSSRSVTGSRTLLNKSLLVVQVAISLMLLIGAGLFLRTVDNLRSVEVGFNPNNLVLFRVNPQLNRYDAPRMASLYEQVSHRVSALPGVGSVTLSNPPLLSGGTYTTSLVVMGRAFTEGPHNSVHRVWVAHNFFDTMEIPLLRGRGFTERDTMEAPKVAIVNEAAVAKFFPNEDPVGRRFGSSPETSDQIEIVGVVRDVKYSALREPAPPTMYVPYQQSPLRGMAFVIRTTGAPASSMPAIREAVREVDANVPLMDLTTQMEQIERRYAPERVFAQAYALFGGLALLVASIGLFGLMSYSVTRRTTEIGIRMALGAQQRSVLQMVMRESLVLVAIGVVIGAAAAVGAGRFIESLLFGLESTDVATSVVAVAVMTCVSAFAGYLPARRASRLDPMVALRHD